MDFTDKRILITGSSRGIGRAAGKVFLEAGGRVALNGRDAKSTAAGIAALGNDERLVAAPGNVGHVADCEAIVATAADALGGLDILVTSAGTAFLQPLDGCTEEMWDATLDTNLKGTFFCIKAARRYLQESKGNIVNVASDSGVIGEKGLSMYCASKAGAVNLTRALALELAPDVRVNCVCPGYVDTDLVRQNGIEKADDPAAAEAELIDIAPLKRIAQPWEIGKAIAYLASDDAVFVTGTALSIDGGTTAGRDHDRAPPRSR